MGARSYGATFDRPSPPPPAEERGARHTQGPIPMNAFAIATRLRLREALHDMRAERLLTLHVNDDRDAERFLKRSRLLGLLIAGATDRTGETILPDVVGY